MRLGGGALQCAPVVPPRASTIAPTFIIVVPANQSMQRAGGERRPQTATQARCRRQAPQRRAPAISHATIPPAKYTEEKTECER
jgi:hypothetical protein